MKSYIESSGTIIYQLEYIKPNIIIVDIEHYRAGLTKELEELYYKILSENIAEGSRVYCITNFLKLADTHMMITDDDYKESAEVVKQFEGKYDEVKYQVVDKNLNRLGSKLNLNRSKRNSPMSEYEIVHSVDEALVLIEERNKYIEQAN